MDKNLTLDSENNCISDLGGGSIFQCYLLYVSGMAYSRQEMWSSAPVSHPYLFSLLFLISWAQWGVVSVIGHPSTLNNCVAITAEGTAC